MQIYLNLVKLGYKVIVRLTLFDVSYVKQGWWQASLHQLQHGSEKYWNRFIRENIFSGLKNTEIFDKDTLVLKLYLQALME